MENKKIRAKSLADKFEVSTRTIYRDIEAIMLAGIPVNSTSGVGGGFEIMEMYKLDKNTFSEEDLITLLVGISSIPTAMKHNNFINTHTKIKSLIPTDKVKTTLLQTEQFHIDFSRWMGSRTLEPYLDIIKLALQKSQLLSFDYINHHGEKTKRQVEPYQLILKSSQWYFQGFCYERKDFRVFKLSRIMNLQLEELRFMPKEHPRPLLDTTEILDKLQITIKLQIHESIMERILDYCDYNNFTKVSKHHYIVDFPFIENDYYYGLLLSFGDQCECLGPLHIRNELKTKIASLGSIYTN